MRTLNRSVETHQTVRKSTSIGLRRPLRRPINPYILAVFRGFGSFGRLNRAVPCPPPCLLGWGPHWIQVGPGAVAGLHMSSAAAEITPFNTNISRDDE